MIEDVKKYIAERLRDEDLYAKVLETLQWILDETEVGYNDIIQKYNDPSQLDVEATRAILEEFGYSYIADIFSLFESQDLVQLIKYLNFISLMKGHRDGLTTVFDFLELDNEITEWWEYQDGKDVTYGDSGLTPFGYATKMYYNLDVDQGLVSVENNKFSEIQTGTVAFWYRFNIATDTPQIDYILSDGEIDPKYIAVLPNGDLELYSGNTETVTGLNLQDGQWHCITVSFQSNYVDCVIVDGTPCAIPANSLYNLIPYKYCMTLSGQAGEGAIGQIAQLNVFTEPFDVIDHNEYYNTGTPINANTHSKSDSLTVNFTFGDNLFDNQDYNGATTFHDNKSGEKLSLYDELGQPVVTDLKSIAIIGKELEFLIPHEWKMTVDLLASSYTADIAKSAESLVEFTRNYVYPVLRWLDLIYEDEFGSYQLNTHNVGDKIHRFSFTALFKTITVKSATIKEIRFNSDQDSLDNPTLFDNNLHQETSYSFYTEDGAFYIKLEDA
jgi:hypothetical protein